MSLFNSRAPYQPLCLVIAIVLHPKPSFASVSSEKAFTLTWRTATSLATLEAFGPTAGTSSILGRRTMPVIGRG